MREPLTEKSFARHVERWMEAEAEHSAELRAAGLYAGWAALTPEGKAKHRPGILFRTPHRLDMHHLVPAEALSMLGCFLL
jgi:hypothetical protein